MPLCAFCDYNGRLSKEHVHAAWIGRRLPKPDRKTVHRVHVGAGYFGEDVPQVPGRLNRAGDPLSQTLRIACRDCNMGWMKDVVDQARPFVEQLIDGDWPPIDALAARAISRWVALTSMVYEFADPRTITVPRGQRLAFRHDQALPLNWRIWIGRFEAPSMTRNFHRAMNTTPSRTQEPQLANTQLSIFSIGHLLVSSMATTEERTRLVNIGNAPESSLRSIWPLQQAQSLVSAPDRLAQPTWDELNQFIDDLTFMAQQATD